MGVEIFDFTGQVLSYDVNKISNPDLIALKNKDTKVELLPK